MWNQIKQEIRRDQYLLLFIGGMFVFEEGLFILASFRNDVPEMENMVISCPIQACLLIIFFAVMTVIRSAGKSKKNDADCIVLRHNPRILLFLIYSLATGYHSFLCSGLGIGLLHSYPDVIREITGILEIFAHYYTGLDIPLSSESSILLLLLFIFSALIAVETYAFMSTVMKCHHVRTINRIAVYLCSFVLICLVIKTAWSLQTALIVKDLLMLILALLLYAAGHALVKHTWKNKT